MASQIELPYPYGTGLSTLYAIVREKTTGKVWSTVAVGFVTEVVADRANYAIALAENVSGSYFYVADFPAASAGVYDYYVYLRAGGSVAVTDLVIGSEIDFQWGGSTLVSLSGLPTLWGASIVGNGRTRDYFLQSGFNKTVRTASAFTVYSTDDSTVLVTSALTEDGDLDPITSVDPT